MLHLSPQLLTSVQVLIRTEIQSGNENSHALSWIVLNDLLHPAHRRVDSKLKYLADSTAYFPL